MRGGSVSKKAGENEREKKSKREHMEKIKSKFEGEISER